MQLLITEDQELLAKTAADFAEARSPVARFRAVRDADDPVCFSKALWKEMAELGWVGIPYPESMGGADLGLAELAVLREALGLGDEVQVNPSGGALCSNPVMATGLIRIGEAFHQIHEHGRERVLAHASSGPCLQQNLVCVLEAD